MQCYTRCALLVAAMAFVVQGQRLPKIEADGQDLRFSTGPTGDVTFQANCQTGSYCDIVDGLDRHDTVIAEVQAGLATLDGVVGRVDRVTETVETNANTMSSQIADLTSRVAELSNTLADIYNCTAQGLLHHTTGCVPVVPHCTAPPAVANADLVTSTGTNAYYPVGSIVRYRCADGHLAPNPQSATGISGTFVVTCGEALTWSAGSSACVRPAGPSCKDIYAANSSSRSGSYMIEPPGNHPVVVFCDMVTPSVEDRTVSGWTLCGKYSTGHESGPRWLGQGFGRAAVNLQDMGDLASFSGENLRWGSIDCRPLISAGAQYFLHASTVAPESLATNWADGGDTAWDLAQYTNIMADVRADPTNLFNLARDDQGECRAEVLTTWNSDGSVMEEDDTGRFTLQGRCLYGDGHHFCTYGRSGAAFSNARGNSNGGGDDTTDLNRSDNNFCYGSQSDTIYWAWEEDAHFCSANVIGTGCLRRTLQARGPGLPVNPFNYLMVW